MAKGEVSVTGVESPEFLAPGWSLTNTVSPSAAGLSSEGYGDLSVDASPDVDDEFLIDRDATVDLSKDLPSPDTNEDVSLGTVNGWVSGYSTYGSVEDDLNPSSRGPASLTITPNLAILNAERAAPAVVNVSLSEAFQTYVNLVSSTLAVTYQATENPVVSFPGWTGNVWEYISNLAAIKGVELSYTGQGLVVRDMQALELDQEFTGDPSYRLEVNSAGQYVEVTYQDQQIVTTESNQIENYIPNPSLSVNSVGWDSIATTSDGDPLAVVSSFSANRVLSGGSYRWESNLSAQPEAFAISRGDVLFYYWGFQVTTSILVPGLSSVQGQDVTWGTTVWLTPPGVAGVRGTVQTLVQPVIRFYNGSDVEISSSLATSLSLPATATGVPLSFPATVPETTSYAVLEITTIAQRSATFWYSIDDVAYPANNYEWSVTFQVGNAFLTDEVGGSFFDGDTPGAAWSGTPGASTSIRPNENGRALYDAYIDNNRIMEVAVGETESYVLESNVWATSLFQPTPSLEAPAPLGDYHVIDSQGVPCTGTFVGLGGEVTVSINELGQIVATLTGPTSEASINGGPYRLASYDGATTRGEFRLAGTGIITNQETIRVPTGADPERFSEDVAYSINYPFINTVDEAYTVGFATGAYANAAYPTVSFTFETDQMPSWDYAAGKWFDYNGSRFRIVSASVDSLTTQVTAPQRNTWGEVLDVHDSDTYGDLNTVWSGLRYRDSLIKPRKDN